MVTPPELTLPDAAVLQGLERLALTAAGEAARLVADERPEDLQVARTKSSATDVVTEMDQRAQDLLRHRLLAARPDDGFYGEEEGTAVTGSGLTWVVDPIDGTVNYLYGIPAYAVSVAAVVGDPRTPGAWQPVAGAVVNPASGESFHARVGGGAWKLLPGGRSRLHTGRATELSMALVGTGFGYRADVRRWQAAVLLEVIEHVRDVRRIGSAALDLCQVADGRLDGYFERGLNPWDLAAGWLVVTEAGGAVSGLEGPPDCEMVLAANQTLHAALHELVKVATAAAE